MPCSESRDEAPGVIPEELSCSLASAASSCFSGRRTPLRPGAVSLLQRARRHRVPTHVLSVSWSSEMLRGALRGKVPVSLR